MKKITAMAIAAFLFTSGINAQIRRVQDSSFESQRNVQHKKMVKDNWNNLNMTAEQKQKMKENQENLKTQRQAIQNDASLTADQKKSKMMDLQKATREKNESILTADQKATMKANQEEMRSENRMKDQKEMNDQKGMKGDKNMKGMKENKGMKGMDLSQDQQIRMKDLRAKMQSESMAIKNNSALTQEQKKQQLQELREKNKEQMKNLLTPEQKLKMKNNHDNQGNEENHRKQGKMKNKNGK